MLRRRMADNDEPTVEMSLEMLSDAVSKAAEDLRAVQVSLDQARTDIASRNTSVPRQVIRDADRAIEHLRQTDESLNDVLKHLAERE
jgi:ABC-type transporter Mla subunit MlaD